MRLRQIRKERGYSVPELSRISGVPVRTIENTERRGNCNLDTFIKLARALGVSLDELAGDE